MKGVSIQDFRAARLEDPTMTVEGLLRAAMADNGKPLAERFPRLGAIMQGAKPGQDGKYLTSVDAELAEMEMTGQAPEGTVHTSVDAEMARLKKSMEG